jgi:hypothetical protein
MTKVMFQIGLLAFFIAAVIFGPEGLPIMDAVARAFIVFMAVVGAQVIVLVVASSMKKHPEAARPAEPLQQTEQSRPEGNEEPPTTQTSASAA